MSLHLSTIFYTHIFSLNFMIAFWSIYKKVTTIIVIYDLKVRILQNELKVKNVQLRIWAYLNLKFNDFYFKLNNFYFKLNDFYLDLNLLLHLICFTIKVCCCHRLGEVPQDTCPASLCSSTSFIWIRPYCSELQRRPAAVRAHFNPKNENKKKIFFVQLVLCLVIRLFNVIESQTGWIYAQINHFTESWIKSW